MKKVVYSIKKIKNPDEKSSGFGFTNDGKWEVTVAARISVKTLDPLFDGNRSYFEYGCLYTKIYIDDFTEKN